MPVAAILRAHFLITFPTAPLCPTTTSCRCRSSKALPHRGTLASSSAISQGSLTREPTPCSSHLMAGGKPMFTAIVTAKRPSSIGSRPPFNSMASSPLMSLSTAIPSPSTSMVNSKALSRTSSIPPVASASPSMLELISSSAIWLSTIYQRPPEVSESHKAIDQSGLAQCASERNRQYLQREDQAQSQCPYRTVLRWGQLR